MKTSVVILGAGGWGGNWTDRALNDPDMEPLAFADANSAVLDALAARGVPRARLFDDADEALDNVSSDAVTVSIPNPQRVPLLLRAVHKGRHVLVDKPLVHTQPALQDLVRAGDGRNSVLMVAQNYRLFQGVRKIKELLSSGEVGRPLAIHGHFMHGAAPWRGRPVGALPGILGLGMEMCIHHVDLMRYFLEAEPQAVAARGWTIPGAGVEGFTGLAMQFVFPDGRHVSYDATNIAACGVTDWCGRWEIVAEHGTIVYGGSGRSLSVYAGDGRRILHDDGPTEEADFAQSLDSVWLNFKQAIRGVQKGGSVQNTFCPLEENAGSVRMILAAARSIESGGEVRVSDEAVAFRPAHLW